MHYSIAHIAQVIQASPLVDLQGDFSIKHLLLDSRNLSFPPHSLFFALPGKRNNGHQFIAELYQSGLRNFVISEKVEAANFPGANFLLVADSLRALQKLTAHHRAQFQLPVIGITGSNGKTIIKEWLFQLLQEDYAIVRSPKSYNSQIGVPLSVWSIDADHQLGIFEAGISQPGEMQHLAPIIHCDIGLFTNLGAPHSEGFSSDEEKLQEKSQLFSQSKTLIYSTDDPRVEKHLGNLKGKTHFRWSRTGQEAELQIEAIDRQENQSRISGRYQNQAISIEIPFRDEAHIENALHCWAVLLHLGYSSEIIAQRMSRLESVGMRLELKNGVNRCILVNDSYNSDLNSLEIALNFIAQQGRKQERHLILSDILQSGQNPKELYANVAQLLAEKGIQHLTAIGNDIAILAQLLPDAISRQFFPDTQSFLDQLNPEAFREAIILIKGARRFSFQRIVNRLSEQAHRTVLEINLSAMLHNFNVYNDFIASDTKVMAMVKASAYGSGSLEVARMLEYQKVDFLAVAYGDEGIDLRKGGIQTPILVLNPEEGIMEAMIRYQLEPEIYNWSTLKQWIKYLPDDGPPVNIHLKLDTGMHRLGFEAADIPKLLILLQQQPQLRVRSVFSHLAASNNPDHDDFSRQQIATFQQFYQQLEQGLAYSPLRHILNSSGISRFPQFQMDMVRLGIGLYGIDNSGLIQDKLETVLTLKASISQIKVVPAAESVGYNRADRANKERRIATISIGYADGLLRGAGNGRYAVFVKGLKVPTVGNVCMDMCMLDLSDVSEAREGDEVVIFGKEPPVQELAACLGTIPYEVFTNVSARVKRVYFQE